MQVLLAKDAIFPITKNIEGGKFDISPKTNIGIPGTIQGEGKLSGVVSLFIRFAGCNLFCQWQTPNGISECDTSYASYNIRETIKTDTDTVVSTILLNSGNINNIVITGGEPFLQRDALLDLCRKLKSHNFHITIETNATIYDKDICKYVDLLSLSPKLMSSTPQTKHKEVHERLRLNYSVIQNFISSSLDIQLKFVVSNSKDIEEIKLLLKNVKGWRKEDILLMPPGTTYEELEQNSKFILKNCLLNGWRYSTRLQIILFGNKIGV